MSEEDPDSLAVERCLNGDLEAFGTLVERYQRQVFNAILHMVGNYEDAREITQQVFLKAFEHLGSYERGRRFFSWIYRIAMNESINHLKARRTFEPFEFEENQIRSNHRAFASLETQREVRQAVLALKSEYRAVVILRHFLGCSYRDAAEALDLPEKTIKSRLFEARQILKSTLAPAARKDKVAK
jgi:RNA polymerase sigma-70 factor (ECF subfamily)